MSINEHVLFEINQAKNEVDLEHRSISNLQPYMQYLMNMKNLQKISLHGNNLKELPAKFSKLTKLQELDISHNKLGDIPALTEVLKELPLLKVLKLPVKKEKEKYIINKLKSLTNFNNVKIVREEKKKEKVFNYVNKITIEKLFRETKEKILKIEEFEEKYLQYEKEDQGSKIFKELQQISKFSLSQVEMKKEQHITESLQILLYHLAEFEMNTIVKDRALNICIDIYGDLGKTVKQISQNQDEIFKKVFDIASKLIKFQEENYIREENHKLKGTLEYENRIHQQMTIMEKQLKRIKRVKEELTADIRNLQHENKRYLEMLKNCAKGEKAIFAGLEFENRSKTSERVIKERSVTPVREKKEQKLRQKQRVLQGPGSSRSMSLKQMKDVIQEMYISKVKYDNRNALNKIPKQTMHQYLFTYLNQKYGLKNLTIEAASSIVNGVQVYENEDSDVSIFGKILRNELQEQFPNNIKELHSQINKLLKMHIKSKNPYKNGEELNQIYQEKKRTQINYEESRDIVEFLFDKSDSDTIWNRLQKHIQLENRKIRSGREEEEEEYDGDMKKGKIRFSVFVQEIVRFYFKKRCRLLKPFVVLFKSRDRNSDGIVNEEQFISIVEEMSESPQIGGKLLRKADPHKHKNITFSEMVRVVEGYPQNNPLLLQYVGEEVNQASEQQN